MPVERNDPAMHLTQMSEKAGLGRLAGDSFKTFYDTRTDHWSAIQPSMSTEFQSSH